MNETPGLPLEWQRWPLREAGQTGWLRAGAVILLILLVGAVLLVSLPPTTAIVLGVPVALAFLPYFLPRRYHLSNQGLVVTRGFWTDRREWAEFGSYQPGAEGYWLLAAPTRPSGFQRALQTRAFYLPRPLDPQTALALQKELENRLKLLAKQA
jgi:hypothetical protein